MVVCCKAFPFFIIGCPTRVLRAARRPLIIRSEVFADGSAVSTAGTPIALSHTPVDAALARARAGLEGTADADDDGGSGSGRGSGTASLDGLGEVAASTDGYILYVSERGGLAE